MQVVITLLTNELVRLASGRAPMRRQLRHGRSKIYLGPHAVPESHAAP